MILIFSAVLVRAVVCTYDVFFLFAHGSDSVVICIPVCCEPSTHVDEILSVLGLSILLVDFIPS